MIESDFKVSVSGFVMGLMGLGTQVIITNLIMIISLSK